MSRWSVVTSEATLCRIALLFLFLKNTTVLGTLDKNVSQSRRNWCEETKACAKCEEKTRPRCFGGVEPLLDADICGCCSSCVALRDSGESCGSQLFVSDSDPVSSMKILATTRCREGLVCLNSTCHDSEANLVSATSPSPEPIPTSHDDRREEETVYLTRKKRPCDAKSKDTVSSFPFDERLGKVVTIDPGGKRFVIVYTGEFRKELDALLEVVDVSQEDFLQSLTSSSSDGGFEARENIENSMFPFKFRNERALDPPPKNIRDILIRGASAHREYIGGAQSHVPVTEISEEKSETVSQGDESTLRVAITTHPGKVETLVDLEEGVDEDEEGRVSSGVLRLSPTEENAMTKSRLVGIPQVWNDTLMTFKDRLTLVEARIDLIERIIEEMARWINLGVLPTRDCLVPQNSDLSFGRRVPDPEEQLALASVLDTVRVPVNRRRIANVDVGLLGYGGRKESRRRNPFRTMINDGYIPRRRPGSGRWGTSRSATKSPCEDRPNVRTSRDVSSTNSFPEETQVPMPSWKMFVFDGKKTGDDQKQKLTFERTKRTTRKTEKPKLFNDENGEESLITGFRNSAVRTASGRLLFRDSDVPQLTTESGTEVTLISVNPDLDSRATSYSIINHGNSRIRVEEIGDVDYDESSSQIDEIQGPSSTPEGDFDRIYESVEAEEEDGDFDYDAAYDHVEYVEVITELPRESWDKPETKIPALPGPERNQRDRRNDGDECGSGRLAKRETPLLLFGSTGRNDPKTILWPSKWAGYRRDRIQVSEATGQGTNLDSGSIAIATTKPYTETLTTPESLITGDGMKEYEENHTVATKTSGFERRGRKNRRKLVWR